jgi:hypothetical protein
MKTLKHGPESRNRRNETQRGAAPRNLFSGLLVAGAMGFSNGCVDCPVTDECNTRDIDVTIKTGERREATTNGQKLTIDVLDIDQETKVEYPAVCRAYAGWARVKVRIESDPVYEQVFAIAPNTCVSVYEKCVAINNVEVTQDVTEVAASGDGGAGGAASGVPGGGAGEVKCQVSNERLSFTLTVGE